MPLFHNEKKLLTVKQALDALQELQSPEIVPFDDSLSIPATSMAFCLQDEVAYIKPGKTSQVGYLGTRNTVQCIVIYIHNEKNHAMLHVSSDVYLLDLEAIIEPFQDKNNIRVTLLGGVPEESQKLLEFILSRLINSNININLEYQQVLSRNAWINSDSEKAEFIHGKLIYKAILFSRRFFGKELDISSYMKIPSADLLQKKVDVSNEQIFFLAAAFSPLVEIMSEQALKNTDIVIRQNESIFKSEETFKKIFELMFSTEGFKYMDMGYSNAQKYPRSKLFNFAIDIQTGKVHKISPHLSIPFDGERNLYIFEKNRLRTYFVCYDGERYYSPSFAAETKAAVVSLKPLIKAGKLTAELKNTVSSGFSDRISDHGLYSLSSAILKIQDEAPESPMEIYKRAVKAYKEGKFADSKKFIQEYQKKIEYFTPDNATAFSTLASACRELKEGGQAINFIIQAILIAEHLKSDSDTLYKKLDSCVKTAELSIDELSTTAVEQYKQGHPKIALPLFLSAFQSLETDSLKKATCAYNIARCYDSSGNKELSEAFYSKALSSPHCPENLRLKISGKR